MLSTSGYRFMAKYLETGRRRMAFVPIDFILLHNTCRSDGKPDMHSKRCIQAKPACLSLIIFNFVQWFVRNCH